MSNRTTICRDMRGVSFSSDDPQPDACPLCTYVEYPMIGYECGLKYAVRQGFTKSNDEEVIWSEDCRLNSIATVDDEGHESEWVPRREHLDTADLL